MTTMRQTVKHGKEKEPFWIFCLSVSHLPLNRYCVISFFSGGCNENRMILTENIHSFAFLIRGPISISISISNFPKIHRTRHKFKINKTLSLFFLYLRGKWIWICLKWRNEPQNTHTHTYKIHTENVQYVKCEFEWDFLLGEISLFRHFSFLSRKIEGKMRRKETIIIKQQSWFASGKCPVFYLCMYIYNYNMTTTTSSSFWFHIIFLHLLCFESSRKNEYIFVQKQTKRSQNSSKCNSNLISTSNSIRTK